MSTLHVEYYFSASTNIDAPLPEDVISQSSLTVTGVATTSGAWLTVPASPRSGKVLCVLTVDAPTYVDFDASSPNPAGSTKILIMPGTVSRHFVAAGYRISAILASDIVDGAGSSAALPSYTQDQPMAVSLTDRSSTFSSGAAQQACAANTSRKLLIVSNPDESRTFWFNTTGTATAGAGSHTVGPGGAFIFDKVVPSGAVSVIGTSGAPYTVKEV